MTDEEVLAALDFNDECEYTSECHYPARVKVTYSCCGWSRMFCPGHALDEIAIRVQVLLDGGPACPGCTSNDGARQQDYQSWD